MGAQLRIVQETAAGAQIRSRLAGFVRNLRDNGFLVKVPPTWRETYARGQRLLSSGVDAAEMLSRLAVSRQQWQEITEACSVRVVALPVE